MLKVTGTVVILLSNVSGFAQRTVSLGMTLVPEEGFTVTQTFPFKNCRNFGRAAVRKLKIEGVLPACPVPDRKKRHHSNLL
jgi:hypothetical protein